MDIVEHNDRDMVSAQWDGDANHVNSLIGSRRQARMGVGSGGVMVNLCRFSRLAASVFRRV